MSRLVNDLLSLSDIELREHTRPETPVDAASVLASVLVINLQLRLMQVAGTAQTLAAASNHAALNLANALGAWLGGLVIAAGYGYRAPSVVGVFLAAIGLVILGISLLIHRRDHPGRVSLRPGGPAGRGEVDAATQPVAEVS